ncbi:flavonoid 3'-monooxygenase [Vigna unguiculata]|uniref:Flavonoid 3'-monooxygenase n=1 Tax=Vigna unguiculata TaxID=3917 RepID=A0A4D6LC90_VIGUN|nr:flavonoid 3'-monooxygenase [Vigna unguiculata]
MVFATFISALLLAALASKIVRHWLMRKSLSSHMTNRLPPGPPRWPIVGNLLQLGQLPHRDLASLCEKYGPLVYLKLGNIDAITTNDPKIIHEILVSQDDDFASRPQTLAAVHLAYGCGPQEAMEFMHITHELFWLMDVIYLGDYLPMWRWFDPYGCEKKMREVEKRVDDFHSKIIEEHRKAREYKKVRREESDGDMDFVDVLLSLPGEDGKEHMDDVEIKALIQDMIAAATDTSAVTNEWAMAEVIKHPHILQKVQQELDSVVGPNRMVLESDLPHLNYLRCIVRETFRMHPAGPFLIPHESLRATTINGYHIPAKTRVFINTHGLGRNTELWDNVGEFRPERHWPSTVSYTHLDVYKRQALHQVYGMTMPKANPLFVVAVPRLSKDLYG